MNTLKKLCFQFGLIASLGTLFVACDGEDGLNGQDGQDGQNGQDFTPQQTIFSNKSSLDPLVNINSNFSNVNAYSLISSTDVLSNGFRLVGAQDGAGLLKDGDEYIYVVNAEDDYSVSRIRFDQYMNPIQGEWLLNAGVADYARQCSGTMWEASIHGGSQDLFLSASESISYDVKGIDPWITNPTPTADFGLDALGEFSWENAVPLPKDAYSGKTVIIGGDDDSSGSEGQVTMYLSENGDADLDNGKIYVLRFKQVSDGNGGTQDVAANTVYNEGDLDFGSTYDVEFVEIVNGANFTKNEMETACSNVFASQFMRVEDVDYQKGTDENARNVYFAVTGRGPGQGTYNDWGTVYKLVLDPTNPLQGQLTQIVSGNTDTNNMDGNLSTLQSPDNICVTENYVYIQEDPNSFSRNHAARIYQTDLNGNNPLAVLDLKIEPNLEPNGSDAFSGEFGALIDISDKVGEPDTFILNLQPHYWKSNDFVSNNLPHNQGGQIVLLQGLPR
ncbi:PhoX family protein [Mesoflavibacter profundi]|uniref:PhoX family protein n=1 Tax=Mesoflavibacter profundi TaxID=2708110 RepID=UPI001CC81A3C|nr:PhoX family protein [Mesoflavibacter profundi]